MTPCRSTTPIGAAARARTTPIGPGLRCRQLRGRCDGVLERLFDGHSAGQPRTLGSEAIEHADQCGDVGPGMERTSQRFLSEFGVNASEVRRVREQIGAAVSAPWIGAGFLVSAEADVSAPRATVRP